MYTTRWGEPIARILMAYPTPQLQVVALEKLLGTVEEYARSRAKDQIAQSVCEGMHEGVASGLKCRSCWEAEQSAADLGNVDPAQFAVSGSVEEKAESVFDVEPMEEGYEE